MPGNLSGRLPDIISRTPAISDTSGIVEPGTPVAICPRPMNAGTPAFASLCWRFQAPLAGDNVRTTSDPARRVACRDGDDDTGRGYARRRTGARSRRRRQRPAGADVPLLLGNGQP